MRSWHWVFLIGMVSATISVCSSAQLVGNFSLSETTYSAGEPIFLIFTVKNTGSQRVLIRTADPLSYCSGYHFELEGAEDRDAPPCRGGSAGSCMSSGTTLAPGESRTDHILLNARYDLRQPGKYSLHVAYRLQYAVGGENLRDLHVSGVNQDFDDLLEIVIAPPQSNNLKLGFAQYEKGLDSTDTRTQLQAAQVIAYLAPKFMEPTIVKMLDIPTLQYYGVEGLRNLGTSSAHKELANFVKNAPPTNVVGAYQMALRYLGEIGDRSDIPVLLDAAHANAPDSWSRDLAIESVAEAGGAAAVPALAAKLNDPSIDTRQDVVRGLYLTGSRAAVPVLIGLLRSPEWRVSGTAEYGLEVLTHRSGAKVNTMNPPPPDAYDKWMRWWKVNHATATIYGYDQCGEVAPLP